MCPSWASQAGATCNKKGRTLGYNITLLAGRILEIAPLQGQPVPCKVRFRLVPGQQDTVQLFLVGQSAQGAPWSEGMRPQLSQWCQRYLGVTLAPMGPGEAQP
jgi:hypothetical protein